LKANISYLDYQIPLFFDWKPGVKYKVSPKGRRVGVTRGALHAVVEWLLDGKGPVLWGETTHGNIERYFDMYLYPLLTENKIDFHFDKQSKRLTINGQHCDFRSADNPENWEGFGYQYIFLNEAGIILKNKSLYINSVLPMLLDFPDSKLIAAGVPKGKHLKDGSKHPFFTLAERALENHPQYELTQLTSYSNPLLKEKDIKELETEMFAIGGQANVDQEINGMFVEYAGENPFLHHYDPAKYEKEDCVGDAQKQLHIWVDFNINPFAVNFANVWQDSKGHHLWMFDEADIKNGSLQAMADLIRSRYANRLPNCRLTGDKGGDNKSIEQVDNASKFIQIKRMLGLRDSQVVTHPNPKQSKWSAC